MAHPQQTIFASTIINKIPYNSILEIGSYNVNGSIKDFISPPKKYLGVDLIKGPGVDHIYDGINLSLNEKFDLGLCFEVFEHDKYYINTFKNLYDHLNKNGILIFTCASTGRLEHGTTRTDVKTSPGSNELGWDYYRNLKIKDFENKLKLNEMFTEYFFYNHKPSSDLYFVGIKGKFKKEKFNLELIKLECLCAIKSYEYSIRKKLGIIKRIRFIIFNLDYPLRLVLMNLSDYAYQNYMYRRIKLRKLLNKIL